MNNSTTKKSRTRGAERWGGRRRRIISGLAALSLAMLGMVATSTPADATVSSDASFEFADGNLVHNTLMDWNDFATTTWTGSAPYRVSSKTVSGWAFTGLEDAAATTSDTAFAGGTKQDDVCATVKGAKAPNKDDLERVYVTSNTVGGDVFLGLAWVRIPQNTTSASAHIGFEFNKAGEGTACPAGSGGLVERTAGDMLIVYDFAGGSDEPRITLRRWITSGSCEVGSNSPPCWGLATDLTELGFAEARVNTGDSVVDAIAPSPPESLGLSEFGEAGINLTDAGVFSPTDCESFGKAYAVSRSSGNSATAQMKDLVGPGNVSISNCGNLVVKKVTQGGFGAFDFTSNTLDPGAFTLTTTAAGEAGSANTGTAYSDLIAGTYDVAETVPTNWSLTSAICSDGSPVTAIAISVGETVTCTFTNTLQQGALRILKQSTKTGNPLVTTPGAVFSYDDNDGVADAVTITDNGTGDGSSTIGEVCVAGLLPGNYTVNETTPPPGYGGASQTNVAAVVVTGTNCGANQPTLANSAVFTNAPLADIQVNFRDGGSGETQLDVAGISCDGGGTASTTAPSGWDDSLTKSGIEINPSPKTITCTIVIDP